MQVRRAKALNENASLSSAATLNGVYPETLKVPAGRAACLDGAQWRGATGSRDVMRLSKAPDCPTERAFG
jgi:hypothetical protein